MRLGVALPQRYAEFGLTAPGPGPAGTVRTLLAGTPAVWCRAMIYTRRSLREDRGELRVLFEQTFGEPFGVADSTGTAAVSGNFLEAVLLNGKSRSIPASVSMRPQIVASVGRSL